MKQVSGTLRLELAQYTELAAFAQFGSDLDSDSKRRLEKGKRILEVLKQEQYKPMDVEKQIVILYATLNDFLSDIRVKDIRRFEDEFLDVYKRQALPVAEAVVAKDFDFGILICGTGIGIGIAANKVPGIRAALCSDTFSAHATREHNDANILTLGERVVGKGLAIDIVLSRIHI